MCDLKNVAAAMLRLHGREAAKVAQDYAERYRALGDEAESRKWLEIGQIVLTRIAKRGAEDTDGG